MRSNVNALTPWSVKPSRRMPSTHAPMNAPMTVPLPPASSVPPMTAAEIAANMMFGAAGERVGRRDPDRLDDPGEAGQDGARA